MKRELKWKWLFFFVGLAVMCLGISMIIEGESLGVGPWDVLHIALFKQIGLSVGSWSIITGLIIVVSTSLILKEWPKLATWINMILCGVFIDCYTWILPNSTGVMSDVIYFLLGVLILGIGCALYISPKLGAGPRDSLMILFVKKWGFSIGNVRLAMEALIALIGWLLGGPVGIGTVMIALFTGYIVQFALPIFEKMLQNQINGSAHKSIDHQNIKNLAEES